MQVFRYSDIKSGMYSLCHLYFKAKVYVHITDALCASSHNLNIVDFQMAFPSEASWPLETRSPLQAVSNSNLGEQYKTSRHLA